MENEDGFIQPLAKGLTEDILIAGIPREFGIGFGSLFAIAILSLQSVVFTIIVVILYFLAALITKRDSKALLIGIQYLKKKPFYHS